MSTRTATSFHSGSSICELLGVQLPGPGRLRLAIESLRFSSGVTAIAGLSGAGKSSLLNVICGFETPSSGSVIWQSAPDDRLPLFWVPQDGGLWGHLTVEQHLETVLPRKSDGSMPQSMPSGQTVSTGAWGSKPVPRVHKMQSGGRFSESTDELLRRLHLEDRRTAFPGELSAGERSRLSVARALASGAETLVMDEPLTHVDQLRRHLFWNVVRNWIRTNNQNLIFATHEADVIVRESRRIVCLDAGRCTYDGSVRELYHFPSMDRLTDHPPAELLGRLNWLTHREFQEWQIAGSLPDAHAKAPERAFGIRPQRMTLQPQSEGPLQVVSSCFHGDYAETRLVNTRTQETRNFLHHWVPAGWVPAGSGSGGALRDLPCEGVAVTLKLMEPQ
ncbi:MAG: ATP-binding cassette domain-containing protein [Planctomycetaceae bacterium]|nr:ATP-binding cassette domain-containing protein [Planctomycetaceae bacterium]